MWSGRVAVSALAVALAARSVGTGRGPERTARPGACTPTVSGALASVFDGSLATFWQTPGLIQQQAVTIDLGCTARVFRFRRYMTCDGTATSGAACGAVNSNGRRHLGFDTVSFAPDAGAPFQTALSIGATGWEAYRAGTGFDDLPYGWTPWLDLKGVAARLVRFTFVDASDALNEIEVEYAEGSGGTPGVSIVDLQTPLPGTPFSMAVGPDRALWIPSLSTEPAYVGHLTRLTT